jgi:pimeloyl-ACP methyl ester carboxylesterase
LDGEDEPVILVGHSRAGAVISQAAEERPEKVRMLVYLAAYLLADGESVSQTALQDERSLVVPSMILAPDRKSCTLREAAVKEALYGECPDEDVILAQSLLAPEALAPLTTPIRTSAANYGRVPRVYIECRRDRALSLSEQRRMARAMPCQQILSLDTDHSPFFSSPDELTAHLLSLQSQRVDRCSVLMTWRCSSRRDCFSTSRPVQIFFSSWAGAPREASAPE